VKRAISIVMTAAACATALAAAEAETLAGQAKIIDGDSIEIHSARIHLLDVDAPESAQFCFRKSESLEVGAWPCGHEAAKALSDWIGQREVTCDTLGQDSRTNWLARCTVGGEDLARWLAASGWAVPARSCKCEVVRSAADEAKSAQRGIWSSAFTMPWDWRKAH
jgi:endonuclease YncB( thermonuclease family)